MNRRTYSAIVLALTSSWLVLPGLLWADGTETLGLPQIPIEAGTAIVGNGVGLETQPSSIAFDVPANAVVKQVLLYWNGFEIGLPTNTIVLNGATTVAGTLIGGPQFFFPGATGYTYRADITSLGLIAAGSNSVSLSGLSFATANNGASIIAIIDEGGASAELQLLDGQDLAFSNFSPPLNSTAPQTFTFAASPQPREAQLTVVAGSVQAARPNIVRVSTGGTTTDFNDLLTSISGDEWDHHVITVDVPAGATSLTIQALSEDCCATGILPASLAWVVAGLVLADPMPPGEIGDIVYCDLNDNGILDPGEPGQGGMTVSLSCLLPDGSTLGDTQTTQPDGSYLFTGIPAGSVCSVALLTIPVGKELGACPADYSGIVVTPGSSQLDFDFCVRFIPVTGVQNLIWLPDPANNTISAINLDGTIDGTLIAPGLLRPVAIAIKPSGIVCVAFEDSDVVAEFNPAGTVVQTHAVGDRPRSLAVDATGSLWVANFGDSTLMKIDDSGQMLFGPGGSLGPAINVDASPLGIGVDALNNVYVVSQGPPSVTKLNSAGAQLVTVGLPPGSEPFDLVLDRGGHVWLTLRTENVVERRASDLTLIESFPTPGANPEAIAIRGADEAWVVGTANGMLYRLTAGGSASSFAVGASLGGLLIDGEGFVWVADSATNQLIRVDGNGVATGNSFTGLAPNFIGDGSGLVPANVLLPLADFDSDTFGNALEINNFVNPLDAAQVPTQQMDFVAPVEALSCTVDAQIVTLTWTIPLTANYTSISIERDGAVVATLAGTDTSFVEPAALEQGTYSYVVVSFEGTDSDMTDCVVSVGAGQIVAQQTIDIAGLATNLFDITSDPTPGVGQPRFYLTDPANGKIYGTNAEYNVLVTIDSPFVGFAPTNGIAFVDGGNNGAGSLVLGAGPNGDPNQNSTVIEIALDGTVLQGPIEITIPVQPLGPPQQLAFQRGGISTLSYKSETGVFLASTPASCELFSFSLDSGGGGVGAGGTPGLPNVPLIPEASAVHPQPGYGLNGTFIPDFIEFGPTGGRVWITNQAPDGSFEIRQIVIENGIATLAGNAIPLAAASAENAFGGFSLAGDEFAVVGLTTSTVYELGSPLFVRGNADPNAIIDIGDSIRILASCFQGQPFTPCIDAYDVDDSGTVGIADSITLLAFLFSGGPPPPGPFPEPGEDPTPDDLPCL